MLFRSADRPMLGLIDLARLKLDELINPQRTEELVAKLEGASNHLSRQILKFWSQNQHLQVKFDVRSARPGGTPFVSEGILYRPAQDCSESYGCRLSINRVTRLSPSAFSEETVRVLSPWPDWPYPHGFHTLSAAGNWTILDAKRMTFLPALAKRRVVYKLHRLRRLVASSRD